MATGNKNVLRSLLADTEKAVKRGLKLERTLLKIVAQSQPGSGTEELLKSVQGGVAKLKKDAEDIERTLTSAKKKNSNKDQPVSKADVAAEPQQQQPAKRSRKKASAPGEAAAEAPAINT